MFDLVIIGAGPAGLAAAQEAAKTNASIALLDMQSGLGGQIWRASRNPHIDAVQELAQSGRINLLTGATVFDSYGQTLLVDHEGQAKAIEWRKLILTCGARDLCLPCPGWTLPGVYSVGGLQALIKGGLEIGGKRIAIAGSGPLLLALLKTATEKGAEVVLLAEQAPLKQWLKFGQHAGRLKPREPLGFLLPMVAAQRLRWSAWPTAFAAEKDGLRLTLHTPRGQEEIACDMAAVSYGLTPNTELAALLGCRTTPTEITTTDHLETTRPGVFAAGEQTGIAGADCALLEGCIAARAALELDNNDLIQEAKNQQKLKQVIRDCFALQPALVRHHTEAKAIFCRCENVERDGWADRSFGEIKLQTRIGMGPCQGRFCGAAHQALFGRGVESLRPPIFPVLAGTYADALRALREEDSHAKD